MKNAIKEAIGDKITLNEFDNLIYAIRSELKIEFDNDLRIKIQDFAERIGKDKSGSEFGIFLNQEIATILRYNILDN